MAGSWLDRGETCSPSLWHALGEIHDHALLLDAAERLGEIHRGDVEELFKRLASLFANDAAARWRVLATFLGRQSRSRPQAVVPVWERWTAGEPISWTVELVEACRDLLQSLEPARIESFCLALDDAAALAAVRVADLAAHPEDRRVAAALQAVERIPQGVAKLHWSLRFLASRPCEPADEVRGGVGAVAAYLQELRYDAPAPDLCRFLDLVDQCFPGDLKRLIEDIAWSPLGRPETLLLIAGEDHPRAGGGAAARKPPRGLPRRPRLPRPRASSSEAS